MADYAAMMQRGSKPQSAASGGSRLTHLKKPATISSVPKRKLSRKARAAALKNLAKARRARRRAGAKRASAPRRRRRMTIVRRNRHRIARKNPVAKKRKFSRKARAAAIRNLSKARGAKRRKKICRRASGKRGAAKRLRRRMPSMPRVCRPKRRRKARHHAAHYTTHHRKSAKRVAAGKKAARTRKRKARGSRHGYLTKRDRHEASMIVYESPRKRRRRKGRRRNPLLANPIANPRRRRRRSHHRRRHHHTHHARHRMRNPLPNPLTGTGEFVAGLFGVGSGFLLASITDRLAATHPLTQQAPGVFTDTPAPGQVYDSEAPQLPIWKDPMRLGVAFVTIMAPGLITKYVVRGSKAKAFAQLATFGAIGRTVGKALDDGIAALASGHGPLSTNMYAQRLYGAELAASSRLDQLKAGSGPMVASAAGTSLQQPSGQFAGVPASARQEGLGATPGQYLQPPSRMVGALSSDTETPDCSIGPTVNPMENHAQDLPFSPYTAGQDNCCPLPPQLPNVSTPPAPYVSPPSYVTPAPPSVTPQPAQPPSPPAVLPPPTWSVPRDYPHPPPPAPPPPPAQPNYMPR
jgi:hypothetical protein